MTRSTHHPAGRQLPMLLPVPSRRPPARTQLQPHPRRAGQQQPCTGWDAGKTQPGCPGHAALQLSSHAVGFGCLFSFKVQARARRYRSALLGDVCPGGWAWDLGPVIVPADWGQLTACYKSVCPSPGHGAVWMACLCFAEKLLLHYEKIHELKTGKVRKVETQPELKLSR